MCSKRAEAPFLCERRRLRILDVRRRRSAGGAGGTTLFRSASSDEDGGQPSEHCSERSEQSTERDARAAFKKKGPACITNTRHSTGLGRGHALGRGSQDSTVDP